MKDFSNASFAPETIDIMKEALDAAIATLPDPINIAHVDSIAETILRTAREGERDPATLQRMALMELQISSHEYPWPGARLDNADISAGNGSGNYKVC